jgi:DNA-binding NtrC family response regulator
MDNITVLLVDDERESRMFAEAVLKQMGFQVVSINSGRKVRKELSRQKVCVTVTNCTRVETAQRDGVTRLI